MNQVCLTLRRHSSRIVVCLIVAFFAGAVAGQSAISPGGLYLRLNEGQGPRTANEAYGPSTIADAEITTVASWIASAPPPYLGNAAYLSPQSSPAAANLETGRPYSLGSTLTFEFAVVLANVPIGTPQVVLEDETTGFEITVVASGGGVYQVFMRLPGYYGSPTAGFTPAMQQSASATIVPASLWTFISIVLDPPTATIGYYVDGVLVSTSPTYANMSINLASTNPRGMTIGDGGPYHGVVQGTLPLDEIRIWTSARTAAEIAANYQRELAPSPRGFLFTDTSSLTFSPSTGSFSAAASIAGIVYEGGIVRTEALIDPIIGHSVTMYGGYTGADLAAYQDITLTPATIVLEGTSATDTLSISSYFGPLLGPSPYWRLLGPLGTTPTLVRPFTSATGFAVARSGTGAAILDSFQARLASSARVSFLATGSGTSPRLLGLEADFVAPWPVPTRTVAKNAAGAFGLGIIGAPPAAQVFNLFVVNPTTDFGQGPFFGLELTPSLFDQINLPLAAPPFRVTTDSFGNYAFSLAAGVIPPGLLCDQLTIILDPTTPTFSLVAPIVRLQF